jgi:hypothetical protein
MGIQGRGETGALLLNTGTHGIHIVNFCVELSVVIEVMGS